MFGIPSQGMEAVTPVTGKADIQPRSLWEKVWGGPNSASEGRAGWHISIWHPPFLPGFCSPQKWKLLCLSNAGSMIPEAHNLINIKHNKWLAGLVWWAQCFLHVWTLEELNLWGLILWSRIWSLVFCLNPPKFPGFQFSCAQSVFGRTGRVGVALFWLGFNTLI